jgi:hypothetical protein
MDKFTIEKYKVGVSQEYIFLTLMKCNNILFENLNDYNARSIVDFKHETKNIYIELKYRQIESDKYDTSVFDKKKVELWAVSKMLLNSYIYIALVYSDNKHYFIKYNKELFDSFDTQYLPHWDTTNYLIPLDVCIGLDDFVKIIKESIQGC